MSLRRGREVELSVEREVLDAVGVPRRIRVSAHFSIEEGSTGPSPIELAAALRDLDKELDSARAEAGFRGPVPRADRSRTELLETYRPRRPQLVEALLADGEVTPAEAEILRSALPTAPRSEGASTVPKAAFADTDRPLAAMPLSNDRTPNVPRPVPELLATFQIGSLKQAGAIRARRQISYDEYMALKRHFGALETSSGPVA
ncbi:MAG: hypothetical protein L3J95_04235 [Thermoplasmata archaeon]|nr:hypothetical protein [Thermoplasmata archaeon]MCI4359615.1 hypothetical protein [Thermoplasmata archaeon]